MQLINKQSNMTDGVECFMDTDVTTYRVSAREVAPHRSGFRVTHPVFDELEKAHPFLCSYGVKRDIDGSFIITVVEA